MRAIGIVAEYDPFHTGHAYHIAQTRRRLGEDLPVVCALSGHWVQRGECAVTDKWTRTAIALRGGVDLVLELPLPWAISSAEGFARGGVGILKATGVVDLLSFGSESGKLEELRALAEGMEKETYLEALRRELDKGNSFAQARQNAATEILGERGTLLQGANDSLGVEYLRAAGPDMQAMVIKRQGISHDSYSPGTDFASASYIRKRLRCGESGLPWLEQEAQAMLRRSGIAEMKRIERAMLACLRRMDREGFAGLPDSGREEGLPDRLAAAAREAASMEEFYRLAKTKRYAHARLRRLALRAFLGLTQERCPHRLRYLRVLGMTKRGGALLREMKVHAALPVLTKAAHIRSLDAEAQALFALECRGTDLFSLCLPQIRPCGLDYTTSPVVILENGGLG